ncbi:RagB/SusD family nutrient uptake outer membrane protein [Chitinophaga ginsengisoli]|uniref:RagB/SusD domain-containing protein n=1 Tax=Chitinophaga ginsengisoli TaxID=363837 RepID=A0A2P8G9Q7_9BACT|nr:RagB/SusD family nutrient uptake outer membrane protein [Chitinophaga ginsengisoli]PSL30703.1 RagB/SusD domain-containing protein [Chitinophaga ginsengisoli]
MQKKIIFILSIFLLPFLSCKKMIEIDPPIDQITSNTAFKNDASAIAVLNGIYEMMSRGSFATGLNSISAVIGIASDELKTVRDDQTLIYMNNQNSQNGGTYSFWTELYQFIYRVNGAVEGLSASKTLKESTKQQLLGEARFLRAFFYFYLVNLYGDVPLVLSTDFLKSSKLPRQGLADVYQQIIEDLSFARENLSVNYLDSDMKSSDERTRPTKNVATSLLSRVYLYLGRWDDAIALSTDVIAQQNIYALATLNSIFLKNSQEAIWQLQPVNGLANTEDGNAFILTSSPNPFGKPYSLSMSIVNSFETSDGRKNEWIGMIDDGSGTSAFFPFKYKIGELDKPVSEYLMVFRLAEQYLIRAEARARKGNITGNNGAESDLNIIRARAGLPHLQDLSQNNIYSTILSERRHEFFSEWGHRWFDIKRMGVVDQVMTEAMTEKGGVWKSYQQLFPIPQQELQRNPSLTGHQNPGYN